ARRHWLTDHQLSAIASEMRDDLGDWLKHCSRHGVQEQMRKVKAILEKCGKMEAELHAQWELQKAAQLSVRAYVPAKLKKELDTILSLQGDLETVEKAINAAKATLMMSATPDASKKILKAFQENHASFSDRVEALYVSLNIHDSYPDLRGANLDFI
ncbi:hypothetical protein CPB84DRAFT_1671998, partial [Gymnopilus junonius]